MLILPQPDPGVIYSIFLIVLYREGLPSWYIWTGFIAITLFVMTLLLEPQYVILIALIIILLVHFKSRLADRNIVLSYSLSSYLRFCTVRLCFLKMFLNNTIEIVLIFYWENSRFKGYWIQQTNQKSRLDLAG
jgi:hypothetical protein